MQTLLNQTLHHSSQLQSNLEPKILYTTSDVSSQSGAFRCLLEMSRDIAQYNYEPILALHRDGLENSLLTAEDLRRTHFLDLPRAKRGRSMGYYLSYLVQNVCSIYRLVKLIWQEQVAIVHINEVLDLYAGIAARIAGVPCVWHIRADLAAFPRVRWGLSRIVLALADKAIVVSRSVQERIFEERGGKKVVVIYDSGPDPVKFHRHIDGATIREEFGLKDGEFLVTLVAKLSERKGHRTLIRAAPKVLASFPNTRFAFVGGKLEGDRHEEYVQEMEAIVQKLGIEEKVIFTGFRFDVPQIMAASDIITHCSTYPDPFPGVVLQGMAVGKPVIASDLGGPREQIENGVSGLLAKPDDPAVLADAICSLLEDKEKCASLGESASERVRKKFDSEVYFQKLSKLYKGLLAE